MTVYKTWFKLSLIARFLIILVITNTNLLQSKKVQNQNVFFFLEQNQNVNKIVKFIWEVVD